MVLVQDPPYAAAEQLNIDPDDLLHIPIIRGFTASRSVLSKDLYVIRDALIKLDPPTEVVTGGAIGGDAFIGMWCAKYYKDEVKHTVIVPSIRWAVDYWWERLLPGEVKVNVIEMPAGTVYKDHNRVIVERSTELVAFPQYPEDDPNSSRSGSWQTVRMARRAGIPVECCVLSES